MFRSDFVAEILETSNILLFRTETFCGLHSSQMFGNRGIHSPGIFVQALAQFDCLTVEVT